MALPPSTGVRENGIHERKIIHPGKTISMTDGLGVAIGSLAIETS
jgi:hypothetical protein